MSDLSRFSVIFFLTGNFGNLGEALTLSTSTSWDRCNKKKSLTHCKYHLIQFFTSSLSSRCYYPHFTDEKTVSGKLRGHRTLVQTVLTPAPHRPSQLL